MLSANEPTRYQNSRMREFNREFGYKTRDQPFEERRKCNGLGRGDQAGSDISHVSNFNKYVKKANVRRRAKQKLVQEINPPTGSRCDAKKSTKLPKPITVKEIFESLRLFNQELQRDLSDDDEEDPHELCTDDLHDEIFFRGTYVISGGPPPEIAPETALGVNRPLVGECVRSRSH